METLKAQLKELEARLYHREEEVIALGERLQKRADLQDVKVGPVYEAYKTMGLIGEDQILGILGQFVEKNHEWMEPEYFWKKYGEINQQLNQLLPLLVAQNYRKETICQAEKVVADLMIVLRYHWGTRTDSLGRICDFISICKYAEYLTIVALERWGAAISNRLFDPFDPSDASSSVIPSVPEPSLAGNPIFDPFAPRPERSVQEGLITERMAHIQDQLGFLSKEEVILQEMHLICEERERLYGISRKLFLG